MLEDKTVLEIVGNTVEQDRYLLAVNLFAGEGGLITGFNKVKEWQHFLAVEIDKKHCDILREVFPSLPILQQDVALVDWKKVLGSIEIDCVIGGPPCQPFSQGSNGRNGWDDPRNGIPSFVKTVKSINPRAFLLENVPRLWASGQKRHIEEIIEEFKEFGFSYTDAKVLDAADFGAPCHRRRLFVYGTKHPHEWPVKSHKVEYAASRQFLVPLLENREPDGEPLPEWVKPKIKKASGDIIIDCKQGNKLGRQYVSLDEPCFTLVASQGFRHRIRYNGQYYRMREAEAAALQGMDSRCTIEGIGNAVNVWQAEAWAKTIKEYLLSLDANE